MSKIEFKKHRFTPARMNMDVCAVCGQKKGFIAHRPNKATVDERLKVILGGTYGGPSISYEEEAEQFVIYQWGDAPVSETVLARGATIEALVKDYLKNSK